MATLSLDRLKQVGNSTGVSNLEEDIKNGGKTNFCMALPATPKSISNRPISRRT